MGLADRHRRWHRCPNPARNAQCLAKKAPPPRHGEAPPTNGRTYPAREAQAKGPRAKMPHTHDSQQEHSATTSKQASTHK
eukprot:14612509-Alexandrium_andersonii.AAC.1